MTDIEEMVCNKFNVPTEVLKTNTKDEEVKLFLESFQQGVYKVFQIPIQFMVNNNG